MAVRHFVSSAQRNCGFLPLLHADTCVDAKAGFRATPAKVPWNDAVARAPSMTRGPEPEALVAADVGATMEPARAMTEAAATAPETTSGETPTVGESVTGVAAEGTNLELAAKAQVAAVRKAALQEGASRTAPGGGTTGEDASLLAWREPPSTEELPNQPAATGWDIVVSGSALAASHPHSSLLARAHHAIDRLGGSLVTGLAELEDEHRSLAAECAAHEAKCRCFAALRCEA